MNLFAMEAWGSEICCSLIRHCWVNGYGDMLEKRRLYGVKLLKSSMEDCGGAGVPIMSLVLMGKVYGNI